VRDDEPEEIGDLSDEEDETLDRKLARLRREVEQIKSTLEERKAEASRNGTATEPIDESEDPLADIGRISEALDAVYSERHGDARGAESGLSRTLSKFAQAEESMKSAEPTTRNLSQPSTSSAEPQLGQTLTKIADFDSRLTFLENAIGLNGLNMPDTGIDMPKLILPTLDTLERLIELATASPSNLDAAQSKTRQLVRDAERLHRLRSEDGDGAPPSGKSSGNNQAVPPISDSEQHTSKVNALYGVLPTIDSLSPTVPLMLDRLRSLRLIHTSAAGAKEVLDDVEKRQAEQAEEIEQWRNALELVEGNLKDGQTALVDNVHKVGELVSQLETRVSKVT
jgi:nuclear migration protein JNM1